MTEVGLRVELGVAVPAAGLGRRAGGRKQYRELTGRPVLLWALESFLADPRVRSVAVALPSEDVQDPPEWLLGIDPRVRVVEGGSHRGASVAAAVRSLSPDLDLVAVHDAARPLMGADVLERLVAELTVGGSELDGAVAGWPAVDTLKRTAADDVVLETPDRRRYWHAQTPQLFRTGILRQAYEGEHTADATDDAELVARIGGRIRMVRGSRWNLKVTLPEDVAMAEGVLRARPEGTRPWLEALADHVRDGGVLVHPTETVYGIGGRVEGAGLEALRRLKGRDASRPVLVLVTDRAMMSGLEWTPEAERLASAWWPGPLTLVLRDPESRYEEGVRSSQGGVAVRNTSHPLARAFLQALGEPLTSTSANAPGEAPALRPDTAARALQELGRGAVRVLDGGPLAVSEPSTVVDCTGAVPRVVREGALPVHRLKATLPELANPEIDSAGG